MKRLEMALGEQPYALQETAPGKRVNRRQRCICSHTLKHSDVNNCFVHVHSTRVWYLNHIPDIIINVSLTSISTVLDMLGVS